LKKTTARTFIAGCLLAGLCVFAVARSARAQVSPAEITDPQLKAAEKNYYSQLLSLYRAIGALKMPFPLQLSPLVGLDPSQQPEADSRGLAFVHFQDQLLLKISGNYNAAYSAQRLTQNQRASQTLSGVIAPILSQVAKYIPADVACDGIGLEIAYHVRTTSQNFSYEGKEILVAVFSPADAFTFAAAGNDSARQEILNRSQVYLDGKPFGLALGQQNPLDHFGWNRRGNKASHIPASQDGLVNGVPLGRCKGYLCRQTFIRHWICLPASLRPLSILVPVLS
jgi:hypothetical protein